MTDIAKTAATQTARSAVENIFTDLRDRRFLKWLFDERGEECLIDTFRYGEELRGLDLFVQGEIKDAWAAIIQKHLVAMLAMERERCAQIIEARLPLYTELGQRNALKECISSIRSAGE